MCSSRGMCRGEDRGSGSSGSVSSSGSQYALCALGVGLIALGIVMIVWTMVPRPSQGDSNTTQSEDDETGNDQQGKTSSVAFVLVGAGVAMLLLAVCLSVRNKRRHSERMAQGTENVNRAQGEPGETEADPLPSYDVPSYYDAVGSGQYPVRQSNLRNSTSQLPSYEDLLEAVENEGAQPGAGAGRDPAQPAAAAEAPAPAPAPEARANSPARHSTRSGKLLRPLRVRRIKSDKLHLKDFRLNLRNLGPVTLEPLTPPPQYDDQAPDFGENLPPAEA
ncbi:transmembrane protein 51b [Conger conger]|uniref:transmembrane protein 51b n=1 Tax=Conger conger TaxID=82655 RepID=UPI002A5AC358|nr:transmembrane protein 51b [Conger conger]XP_061076207.1 transmembrane protein 51b [Conger conger]XP_061076208.1 transmembrane protein 51b [Conger conger]XP_061076209.1 transmembrane protein 51b [Conger conger]